MISFRRAALLGLNAPLSAIMLAVLGLWSEGDYVPTWRESALITSTVTTAITLVSRID